MENLSMTLSVTTKSSFYRDGVINAIDATLPLSKEEYSLLLEKFSLKNHPYPHEELIVTKIKTEPSWFGEKLEKKFSIWELQVIYHLVTNQPYDLKDSYTELQVKASFEMNRGECFLNTLNFLHHYSIDEIIILENCRNDEEVGIRYVEYSPIAIKEDYGYYSRFIDTKAIYDKFIEDVENNYEDADLFDYYRDIDPCDLVEELIFEGGLSDEKILDNYFDYNEFGSSILSDYGYIKLENDSSALFFDNYYNEFNKLSDIDESYWLY